MGLGELVIGLRVFLIGCAIGNWGISHVSCPMELVGDFSLVIPYGVRAKGFLLWSLRVKGCPS